MARGKSLLEATEKDVRFTFDVNTLAHYWMIKEFLPSLIENNHGMVVTVASIASWVTGTFLCSLSKTTRDNEHLHILVAVPNMVDYAASKHAALAFHEGLTAELATRYNAPRVRTVVVNQGYTKTPLFQGYNNESTFMLPTLEPETVAEKIVRQVLSGKSGQVICPTMAVGLTGFAATPHWYQYGTRKEGAKIMPKWHGRQVVEDLDRFYDAKDKDVEGSTVLVSEAAPE